MRLWVDGHLLINHWSDHSPRNDQSVPVNLTAGKRYDIQVEFYDNMGGSLIQLSWRYFNQGEQIIPRERLYPLPITLQPAPAVVSRVWLSDLPELSATNGWGPFEPDRSNGEKAEDDGKTISVGGRKYTYGLGVHAKSEIRYALDDRYDMFKAIVGVDDEVGDRGAVVFEVWADGRRVYQSPTMKGSMPGLAIEVPVEDVRELKLVVTDAGDGDSYDHADWAEARFEGVEKVKFLSDMNWVTATNGSGPVERDRANGGNGSRDGPRIKLDGQTYRKGLGTRAVSEIRYRLDKQYELFSSVVGIDDSSNSTGFVIFEVWSSNTDRLYRSEKLKRSDQAQHVALSVKNLDYLILKVLDGGDGSTGDLADWADAKLLPMGSDGSTPPPTPTPGVPTAPTGLAAIAGNTQVKLEWKAVTGATGYNVYRGTASNGESETPIATNLISASFMNTGVTNGTKYFYKVRAVNAIGMSSPSNEASATPGAPPPPAPAAPAGLTATAGNTQVMLNWQPSEGAASYNVYRGTASNGQSTTPVATNITGTSFTNTGLNNGTKYFYKVRAVNAAGMSGVSNEASATPGAPPPGAPTGLSATAGNARVTLNWTAVVGATSYSVFRGAASNGQATTPIATSITGTTYANTGLTNGTTYFYKVAAVNSGGPGPLSTEASATPIAPPTAPTGLSTASGNAQITLNWQAVAGTVTYNVYRGTAANAEASTAVATGLSAPTFLNTGLTNGTTYFFKVTAVNTSGESPRSTEVSATPSAPPPSIDSATLSAFRLVRQATWGPKPGDVDRVKQIGAAAFLDEQFNAPASQYPDTLYAMVLEDTQEHMMRLAVSGPDQLRQRAAWALHQIWVVSGVDIEKPRAIVNYKRVLLNGAFGNYRDLMINMTLNPAMGRYLNMLNNRSQAVTGAVPNENYARELLQLFTIGLVMLNPDGSQVRDAQGRTVPTYTEDDVKELARIFTGWTFGDGNPATVPNNLASENYTVPMEPVARYHDTGVKTVLGTGFPAGVTAREELDRVLDLIFNHPNVGPFICRELIQRLVTSNPSPTYIRDITAVFENNGSNVRGDLAAVFRAVLAHPEAALGTPTAGKLMEPALFVAGLARAFNAQIVDHPFLTDFSEEMGQKVLFPGSVFNYFSPNYRIRGTMLFGPEFQILTSVTALSRTNFVGKLISGGFGSDVTLDLTPFTSRASDAAALVDYCSLFFMGGQMSIEQRTEIINAVQVTAATNPNERVRTVLYLTLASAQYQVDR